MYVFSINLMMYIEYEIYKINVQSVRNTVKKAVSFSLDRLAARQSVRD